MPKLRKPLSPADRIADREEILALLDKGEIELGEAIRRMRLSWTGLSQGKFGKIAGVSGNTMSAIERDAGNANVKTLKQILKRFGMSLTIRPVR